MLTEPLTTPPTRKLRILYGAFTGLIFAPVIHVASVYVTPELSLCIGNLLSYIVSPKVKLRLTLKRKIETAQGMYDFYFAPDKRLAFVPGQYLEWTLGVKGADSRGNRRYFTIASAPTEEEILMGVKFYPEPSTFKKALQGLKEGDTIMASQLAGDFTLPKDKGRKLAFIAGGIGITPFRSMLKHLADTGERRDIVLLYSVRTPDEIAYEEVFDEAAEKLGVKRVYTITDSLSAPTDWNGRTGRIDEEALKLEVPDYAERIFYLSGPHAMVEGFEKTLHSLGVSRRQIKKDFFPGFA
jgi:ferredoxin-NADP reductase